MWAQTEVNELEKRSMSLYRSDDVLAIKHQGKDSMLYVQVQSSEAPTDYSTLVNQIFADVGAYVHPRRPHPGDCQEETVYTHTDLVVFNCELYSHEDARLHAHRRNPEGTAVAGVSSQ